MPEGQALYDSGFGGQNAGGMFIVDTPLAAQAAQAAQRPAATPGPSQSAPQVPVATTQQIQGQAEYADGGEVSGGGVYLPFGPPVELELDDNDQPIDPGYRITWTDAGARRTFRIADSVGLMPLLRFAHAAKVGMDTDDMEGMAALYTMIQDVVDPEDWPTFVEYATVIKAEDEELMEFVSAAMEVISARPRKRRGSSSATSPKTSVRSKASSSRPGSGIPSGDIVPPEMDGLMPVGDLVK